MTSTRRIVAPPQVSEIDGRPVVTLTVIDRTPGATVERTVNFPPGFQVRKVCPACTMRDRALAASKS